MSLNKAIASGKEHRKPYYDSRRFDHSCRNHGSCDWCRTGRLHKHKRRALAPDRYDMTGQYTVAR